MKVADILARFASQRLWGSVTIHFMGGCVTHVQDRRTVRPSADRRLAAIVGDTPEVAASLAAGESREFVFARVRGGRLALLAVETHHTQEANDVGQGQDDPTPAEGAADR